MSTKRILLLLAVCALVALAILWRRDLLPAADASRVTSAAGVSSSARPRSEASATAEPARGETARTLHPADSYRTLSQIRSAKDLSPELRAELLQWGRSACVLDFGRMPPTHVERERGLTNEWQENRRYLREFHDHFCDIEPTEEDLAAALAPPGSDLEVSAQIYGLEGEQQKSLGAPTAFDLLEHSHSSAALQKAADFLLQHGAPLPQVRRVPFPASLPDGKSRELAQHVAVTLAGCRLQGGCGPEGVMTPLYCAGHCAPGRSLEQALMSAYPPELLAYSRRLADAMVADISKSNLN